MKKLIVSVQSMILLIFWCSFISAQETDIGLQKLEHEIARVAKVSGGTVGVGVIHLETGRKLYYKGDQLFPMASTYKVPIAVQLLHRVEQGDLDLDSLVTIQPGDLHLGSGTLSRLFDDPGVILSVRNLLELMMLISDNSATDICLRLAGGSDEVNNRLRIINLDSMRVDRSTLWLISDYLGVSELPPYEALTPDTIRTIYQAIEDDQREAAAESFNKDQRDTSTPKDMALLLQKIWQKSVLNEVHSELLIDIMKRCETGENRLKGFLPPETVVAHKTGTIGGCTNDVGVITLPEDAGHVVLAVFVKNSEKSVPEREKAIAHIARGVYDYFLFNPVK